MSWQVKFFQTARGNYPVSEFIENQEKATQAKIANYINLLVNYGPYLKPPYMKKLQSNLYELRTSGKVAVRILYTISHGTYYLLHAFKKKTEKTPKKELGTALDRIRNLI